MENNSQKNLNIIPRNLNKVNIDQAIVDYKELLKEIPLKIESSDLLGLMKSLKRDPIDKGPYPHVSIFESANRIMTDLVVLYGAKMILNNEINGLVVNEIKVELGNENRNPHDLIGKSDSGGIVFIGEAFNVATSYFAPKKSSTTKKFKESNTEADYQIIFCNDDSHLNAKESLLDKNDINIIPVKITL